MSQDKIESRRAFMKKVVALSGVVAFMAPVMASEEKKDKDVRKPVEGCAGTCKGICRFQCDNLCIMYCKDTCMETCTKTCVYVSALQNRK